MSLCGRAHVRSARSRATRSQVLMEQAPLTKVRPLNLLLLEMVRHIFKLDAPQDLLMDGMLACMQMQAPGRTGRR